LTLTLSTILVFCSRTPYIDSSSQHLQRGELIFAHGVPEQNTKIALTVKVKC